MKIIIYHDKVEFISEMQGWFNIHKSINVAHLINKTKDQIIWLPLDTEKAYEKLKKKDSEQSGYRGNVPQHNKSNIWHSQPHIQWRKAENLFSEIRSKLCHQLKIVAEVENQ